jgi:hypothetical protein
MSEIDRYYAWVKRVVSENPDWDAEAHVFFMDLYTQTYPARRFPLMIELLALHPGDGRKVTGSNDQEQKPRGFFK